MKLKLVPTVLCLVCAFQLSITVTAAAADSAPPFIEVGKRYTLAVPSNSELKQYQFKVLELANAGWVKVAMVDGNQVMWLNTNQALLIAPFPQQTAE